MIEWTDTRFSSDNSIRWNMNFRIAHQRVQTAESCGRFGLLFTVSGGSHRDKRGLQRSNEISIYGHRKTTYPASKNDHFLPRYQIFSNVLSFFFYVSSSTWKIRWKRIYSSRIVLCMGNTFHRSFGIYGYV